MKGVVTYVAPSNIALIKYWGKRGFQRPINPSLSLTLKNCTTKTCINYSSATQLMVDFTFMGEKNLSFQKKIENYLLRLSGDFPQLKTIHFKIESQNTFPHSSGIASSASSMAALALCVQRILERLGVKDVDVRLLARWGSGSACRSLFGGVVLWEDEDKVYELKDLSRKMQDFCDLICIVDSKSKKFSSTLGHESMNNHPFLAGRIEQAHQHLKKILTAMENDDDQALIEVIENEAMTLHALMMSSDLSMTLMNPKTLVIIEKIREWRKTSGHFCAFTLDAGPNVHLIYRKEDERLVRDFYLREIQDLCEEQGCIWDCLGEGPVIIRDEFDGGVL